MMAALFSLFTIEMFLKAKTGGHSHGGPMGQGAVALAYQGARPGVATPQNLPSYGNVDQLRSDIGHSDFGKPHTYTQFVLTFPRKSRAC